MNNRIEKFRFENFVLYKLILRKFIVFILSFLIFTFFSCNKTEEQKIAVLWTDCIELLSYCEVFNNSQNNYKVIAEYKKNPADAVINTSTYPDIVISPWLKGKSARKNFKKLNNLFGDNKIQKNAFYEELLNLGNISGNQYLLPVSFNIPVIIFSSANKNMLKNDFTISLDEIKSFSKSFNKMNNGSGAYSKMGFSPRWFDDCLYMTANGFLSSFEEDDNFFSWNDNALQTAVEYIRNWSTEVNTSANLEDEFKFKYLYESPYVLIRNERCLFYYLYSKDLFSMTQDRLENIDFRWLAFNNKTPLKDDILYAGICNKAKNKKAAEAFFIWFFNEETQKKLLDKSSKLDLTVMSFGLAGGFSALQNITEKLFPRYYPLLLAHLPQTKNIYVPHILPSNWLRLKNEILMPYLTEACNSSIQQDTKPSLSKKIKEWYKNK